MKTAVKGRYTLFAWVFGGTVLLLSCGTGWSQSQGSRPIEFSEPRNASRPATNEQNFGADRRRLKDLEDRLSKTFNFFESGDSLGGAPAPRLPRRAPVSPKRSKSSGIFDTDEDKSESVDPLDRLRELLESDSLADPSAYPEERDGFGLTEPDLLESLKRDDWLANGTLGDMFWDTPLETEEKPDKHSPWEATQDFDTLSFRQNLDEGFRPRLEGFLGRNSANQSAFGTRSSASSSFSGTEAFELGRPAQLLMEAHRDDYRALLGFGVNPILNNTSAIANEDRLSSRQTPPAASSMGLRRELQQSQYPVGGANRTSLYPTAPIAPQRPSVFDPIEVDIPVGSAASSANLLASPFYEPPRRQF